MMPRVQHLCLSGPACPLMCLWLGVGGVLWYCSMEIFTACSSLVLTAVILAVSPLQTMNNKASTKENTHLKHIFCWGLSCWWLFTMNLMNKIKQTVISEQLHLPILKHPCTTMNSIHQGIKLILTSKNCLYLWWVSNLKGNVIVTILLKWLYELLQLVHLKSFSINKAWYGYGKDGHCPACAYGRPVMLLDDVCLNWTFESQPTVCKRSQVYLHQGSQIHLLQALCFACSQ